MDEKTALTYAITRGLAYQENGGKIDLNDIKPGKTGETKSIFQFEPATWKKDAQQFLGNPNAPITPDNEVKVVTSQVSQWIDKGYDVKQMASMWNAGVGEPDAYTGKFSDGSSSVGVNNKYGVKYDVPSYANNVAKYAQQFYTQDLSKQVQSQGVQPQTQTQPKMQPQTQQNVPNISSNTGNTIGVMRNLGSSIVSG